VRPSGERRPAARGTGTPPSKRTEQSVQSSAAYLAAAAIVAGIAVQTVAGVPPPRAAADPPTAGLDGLALRRGGTGAFARVAGLRRAAPIAGGGSAAAGQPSTGPPDGRSFHFTRGAYSSGGWRRYAAWATDFPKADRQFLTVLRRLIDIDAYEWENPIRLDDPELHRFPFLYMLEVGYMALTPGEVEGLRRYLLAGGFLMVDDFWGTVEWANFEHEIGRVLPGHALVELPRDHPIFHVVYRIDDVVQVPSIGNARRGRYWERDGYVPNVRGIFDETGRLLVVINWNTDLGDAWEWAEQPDYPVDRSTYAFQVGINTIVYAMSH
jgi:hypothetical protein